MSHLSATKTAAELASTIYGDSVPMTAMLELADRCNETCVHCYQVQGQKGELETSDWKAILDELAEMGVLFLTLSGGEVTLRKDFLELVRYAREKRFALKIFTNGLSMTRELAKQLAELAVQEVQISVYSHRAEAHDWLTGVPGSWERTVKGVRYLVEFGVGVVIKTPLMRLNQDEMDAYVCFANELGADYAVDPHLSPRENGDLDPLGLLPNGAAAERLLRSPHFASSANSDAEDEPRPKALSSNPCGACRSVHIEANGEMRPCAILSVPVGQATRGVQREYRDNPTAAFIRNLDWNALHGCRECDLRAYCGRCHSDALLGGGDALGPYNAACEAALRSYAARHGCTPCVEPLPGADVAGLRGPFRKLARGHFRQVEDRLTDEDLARRQRQPWVVGEVKRGSDHNGELVQLRRPGRTKPVEAPMPLAGNNSPCS